MPKVQQLRDIHWRLDSSLLLRSANSKRRHLLCLYRFDSQQALLVRTAKELNKIKQLSNASGFFSFQLY